MLSLLIYWTDLDAFPPMLFSRFSTHLRCCAEKPVTPSDSTQLSRHVGGCIGPLVGSSVDVPSLELKKHVSLRIQTPEVSCNKEKKAGKNEFFGCCRLTVTDYLHMFFQGVPRCMISDACNNFFVNKNQPRVDPRKHARTGELAASC